MAKNAATTIHTRTRATSRITRSSRTVASTMPMVAAMVRTGTLGRSERYVVDMAAEPFGGGSGRFGERAGVRCRGVHARPQLRPADPAGPAGPAGAAGADRQLVGVASSLTVWAEDWPSSLT